ncbi:MAG: ShET2/EspL2 family type III secretion system effector toxin [Limnobacter sp.]|nr:ShET2/EspL2 family type III secretion system effector toxin [Limnobacter sp.]
MLTEGHAMALHVELKTKSGVDYFAVKLYDPNLTNNYTRVESFTAKGLRKLTFETMMPCLHFAAVYSKGNAKLSMVAVCLDEQLEPQMSRPTVCESPVEMYNTLRCGVYTQLALFLKHIFRDSNDLTNDPQTQLLAAERADGTPGLYMAVQEGHTETVVRFAQAILDSNRSEKTKAELLSARNANGTSGLTTALEDGHTETVERFTQTILNSNLSKETQDHLLAAKLAEGTF